MSTTISASAFGISQSDFRASQQHTAAFSYSDSPLTQLPTPDFNFDDLRKRMSDFTAKFDAYIERGRRQVLSERNSFRARLSELNEDQKSTASQIQSLQGSLSSHSHILSREAHEKQEIQTQIAQLSSHSEAQRAHKERLSAAIASTQRQIDQRLSAQAAYADRVASQSSLNAPELSFWETYLGTNISGAGEDGLIRVTYSFEPPRGQTEEVEATFELKVPEGRNEGYKVVYTKPKLEVGDVERVVRRLNESRDISVLLKGMRTLFRNQMGQIMVVR